MAETVAKAALGPRPGPYILKFWQGSVEIVLRGLVVVGGLASLIASAIALEALVTFPADVIDTDSIIVDNLRERDLQFNSQAGAGTGIAVSVLLMFLGIAVIVVRFLNFGLVNAKSKIFLSIDIIVNFLLATGMGIAGILSAYMASLWAQVDNISAYSEAAELTRVTAAIAGTTLFTTLLLCFVMLWMMYYLIQKWNDKLIKETLKSAI